MPWRKYELTTPEARRRENWLALGIVCVTLVAAAITFAAMVYPRPSLFLTPGQKGPPQLFAGLKPVNSTR
jgi:hypothetical protein